LCASTSSGGATTSYVPIRTIRKDGLRRNPTKLTNESVLVSFYLNGSICMLRSSARNPSATGNDPVGCRSASASCIEARSTRAPFRFNEVRGGNWGIWVFGSPDGFNVNQLCDGIIVRDGSNSLVWLLAVGESLPSLPETRCPCEASSFRNSSLTSMTFNASGPYWTCDRAPLGTATWTKLFHDQSRLLCSADASAAIDDVLWFQRTLSSSQTVMSVSICLNEAESNEDLKLSSRDLYVRGTVGFDKTRDCPTTTTTSTATSSTTTTKSADISTGTGATATIPADGTTSTSPVDNTVWIVPTAIAVLLALVLCGVVLYFVKKGKQNRPTQLEMSTARDASPLSERAPGYSIPSPPVSSPSNYDQVPIAAAATSDSIKPW
jgi:hypothetical protein